MHPYTGVLAVDAKDFTRLPAIAHPQVSRLIPALVDDALAAAGLGELTQAKRFAAHTGDGIAFGFATALLPFIVWPFVDRLESGLSAYNANSDSRPGLRLRVSVHVGPLPDSGRSGDGEGTARNDTHRLLDSEPVKEALARSSAAITSVAAIFSQRVYDDVILGGYAGLHPDLCAPVEAAVPGKPFRQSAWLYVPRPSGDLLGGGLSHSGDDAPGPEGDGPAVSTTSYGTQTVGNGIAVMGSVSGGLSYQQGVPASSAHTATPPAVAAPR
ncbi:hypothetical protein ADK75_02480 [Streptomyces virginiae]|uniref:Aromatic ring-opening dioxygenase LigA n=2 Tax=Streptomyces TaxID=1883 RepID=A0A0L8N6B9_STRVG|nr:hypothetical protein ADK75_02480 [Streptomyces virginiae]